jgi:serine/threonine-protein kinase
MNGPEPVLTAVDEIESAVRAAIGEEYRIDRLLGRGGMSVVFLAEELALKRSVALKVFPLTLALEESASDRFRHEAQIAASLEHPHIAPIHRFGVAPGFMWYTMKYIDGFSLAETLRDVGRLSRYSVLSLVEQAASALDYAHHHGIVHRDMKPANIMLDESNCAYVCDFGVAKTPDTKLTQTGRTIGTPAYMSPEQLYDRPLDGRSDQYSLAVMVFELLTGRHPFEAESVADIIQMHCTTPPPLLSEFLHDLPEPLVEGVAKAMSKEPDERFDSVIGFLSAIGGRRPPQAPQPRMSTELTEAVTERIPAKSPPKAGRRSVTLAVGAALGVAATLGAVSFTPVGNLIRPMDDAVPTAIVPAEPGHIFVSAEPWGELYIDGNYVGNTPALNLPLAAGSHVLRIEREGYVTVERDFELTSGQELRITDIVLRREP